jgi:hypothetical protein
MHAREFSLYGAIFSNGRAGTVPFKRLPCTLKYVTFVQALSEGGRGPVRQLPSTSNALMDFHALPIPAGMGPVSAIEPPSEATLKYEMLVHAVTVAGIEPLMVLPHTLK